MLFNVHLFVIVICYVVTKRICIFIGVMNSFSTCPASTMDSLMEIDGSILEGGGQVLRMAIALSVLQKIPVRIFNIRAGRSKPGLSPQHLKGLEMAREMTGGQLMGAQQRSMEVTFRPGQLTPGQYLGDTGTAGSVGLIIQLLLPCALFSSGPTILDLRGGTNADMAPQIDYTTTVFLALLKRFGGFFNYNLFLRGYYPKGGGKLKVEIPPVKHLTAVEMVDPGSITRIWGTAFTAGNCPFIVSKQMAQAAESILKKVSPSVIPCIRQHKESPDTAVGTASGIYLFAETNTGCVLAGTALGRRDLKAEKVGQAAAEELAQAIQSRVCVDSHAQDQVIILMALAKGTSRVLCGPITLHTETAIYMAQLMTKAKFTIHKQDTGNNIIECEGIGLENEAL
ncbi:RNA 3'-terminal phosphate cyclase isoform X1 [Homalodisca vitripennis]|uniref:RNA 3'-terminal phosphate cyclase isoform X1 n=2 Tax=Homalodisca vitripennis TaxID=197043 RepID=UPI001EEAD31A|nr:RNA 3'-terminal phosphate cyclase isoform X1 [Homalodisca vitripennis]